MTYRIVNIIEGAVTETVDSVLPTLDACHCDQCKADIICLVLNQLEPRYVVHRYGQILSRAEFDAPQKHAEILSAVMRAVKKIHGRPHDDRPSRHAGG
jgi:competence protein ComFB